MPHSHQPHFFQPLLPGFETGLKIPISFYSRYIQGNTAGNTWTLRSDASDLTWEVLQEERTLTRGWQAFTEAHDLRVGDIVIFKLEVTETSIQEDKLVVLIDYSFRAEVTETSIQEDKLVFPVEATACPALNKAFKEAILLNIDGKPWNVRLRFSEPGGYYFIKGWRKFCRDNKCRYEDLFAINIVGDGKSPPLLAVYAPTKEILGILKTWKKKLNIGESSRRFV